MTSPWADPVGLVYLGLFSLSGVACLLLIPRAKTFDDPEIQAGMVGLLGTAGAWAVQRVIEKISRLSSLWLQRLQEYQTQPHNRELLRVNTGTTGIKYHNIDNKS